MSQEVRLPPQNIEAEMSVLGGALQGDNAINRAMELLVPEDFYRKPHQRIFGAMLELVAHQEPVDYITLTLMLKKRGDLDEAGGCAYLETLVDYATTTADIVYYAKIVKEKSIARMLINTEELLCFAGLPVRNKEEAVALLQEALGRLVTPSFNSSGFPMQVGGAYWRVMQVALWLNAHLEEAEGNKHAQFLRKIHGDVRGRVEVI